MARDVHLELLVGRRVVDPSGRVVGRIEEVRAHRHGSDCLVDEFHLGPAALVERLSAAPVVGPVLRLLGRRPRRSPVIPWQELDLSDPERPVWRPR
jgi:hypothetical protein